MYPIVRLLSVSSGAQKRSRLHFADTSEISFYCRPWDLDLFMEMNNGRILTLYDLGRMDLAIRTGLMKVLKNNRWGLAVAGSSNRFRRRVHLFDKVTIKSSVVGYDAKWIYIAQSMWVKGQATSSGLLRTCVTEQGRAVDTQRVLNALGAQDWQVVTPQWVEEWLQAEEHRPWPPEQS